MSAERAADVVQVPCGACGTPNRVPRARLGDVPVCGRCRARLFPDHPVALDDATFARFVARSDVPVLVDFWAAWCGPCKAMAPHFERAAAALAGRVLCAKVDTDAAPETSRHHAVQSIPTLVLLRGGEVVARQSGALSQAELAAWVDSALGSRP